MNKLFLAWQEPKSRRWFPIGCLEFDGSEYHFFIFKELSRLITKVLNLFILYQI